MKKIVFDLDGTLIDSSTSILASFASAFRELGMTPKRELVPEVIGPPLMQTLSILAGTQEEAILLALAEHFKSHYDTEGYKATTVFPGVEDMLKTLAATGAHLFIATNKRLGPTQKILEYLGWRPYFTRIYALDYFDPPLASKKLMLEAVLQQENLRADDALYVGDRLEDGEAAEANDLEFAMVTWGYNDGAKGDLPAHWPLYATPAELTQKLTGR